MSIKLNRFDDCLTILDNEINIAVEIYDSLRIPENNKDRILDHKISCQNLIEEIDKSVSKISNWIRGREQLKDLLDIKYLIFSYKEKIFARDLEEAKLRFDRYYHLFFSLIEQLKRLFD